MTTWKCWKDGHRFVQSGYMRWICIRCGKTRTH